MRSRIISRIYENPREESYCIRQAFFFYHETACCQLSETDPLGKHILPEFHFVWAVLKKFDGDHGFFLSSGVTFDLLICLIPPTLLLLGLLGAYLYNSDQEGFNHIRGYLENAAPSLDPGIMKNMLAIICDRKIVGILGLGGPIWASPWVFSSLRIVLNTVFQVQGGGDSSEGKQLIFS